MQLTDTARSMVSIDALLQQMERSQPAGLPTGASQLLPRVASALKDGVKGQPIVLDPRMADLVRQMIIGAAIQASILAANEYAENVCQCCASYAAAPVLVFLYDVARWQASQRQIKSRLRSGDRSL